MSATALTERQQRILDLLEVEESAPAEMILWYLRHVWKSRLTPTQLDRDLAALADAGSIEQAGSEWRLKR